MTKFESSNPGAAQSGTAQFPTLPALNARGVSNAISHVDGDSLRAFGVQGAASGVKLARAPRDQGKAISLLSRNLQQTRRVADRRMVLHLEGVSGIRSKLDVGVEGVAQLIVYGRDQGSDSGCGMGTR